MRCWLCLFVAASLTLSAQTKNAGTLHPQSVNDAEHRRVISTRFELWEKIDDVHRRAGEPGQYYVPMIDKLVSPSEFEHYQSAYKKIYDVFYRDTSVGLVRVLVAYAKDDSHSHLDPDIRVSHVFFIFDKNVVLRDALAAIDEVRELCAGGCRMNGFAASVIAQPASPSQAQLFLARQMRQQWNDEMPDATPGVQVFYRDSPYPVDFEHSLVERIDLTLVSNASQEKYSITVRRQEPTMLNVWHPHGLPEVAPQQ